MAENNFVPSPSNTFNFQTASRLSLPNLKKATKEIVARKFLEKYNDQAQALTLQGDFLRLLQEEQKDVSWKSYIYAVPRGVMSFAMRASTNSLATPDNLARWGKVVDATCRQCSVPDQPNTRTTATLGHLLNNCPKMLDRYEWRHDGVLAYLYSTLLENKPEGMTIYADIEGAKVNGGTIPPEILVTSSRPDIAIINRNTSPSTVLLVELTVPFSQNIEAANARKRARYEFLKNDIKENGFSCCNMPLEVCSRGQITSRNRETLLYLCHTFGIRKFQQVIKNCSKLALLGSYAIYLARNAPDWSGSGLLTP